MSKPKQRRTEFLDPVSLIRTARSFRMASLRCMEPVKLAEGNVQLFPQAAAVTLALACEIALKALMHYRKVDPANSHTLVDLFDALPAGDQEMIIFLSGVVPPEFRPRLEKSSRVFVEWRYIYEAVESKYADLPFLDGLAIGTLGILDLFAIES